MAERTIAKEVAEALGGDGSRWDKWDEVMGHYPHKVEAHPAQDLWRHVFEDGSAIVEAPGGWDVEGDTPFSWAGTRG